MAVGMFAAREDSGVLPGALAGEERRRRRGAALPTPALPRLRTFCDVVPAYSFLSCSRLIVASARRSQPCRASASNVR